MIRFILFLCKKIIFIDRWVKVLSHSYLAQTTTGQLLIEKKNTLDHCRRDMERLRLYRELGEFSGAEPPQIIPQPKQGVL